MRLSGLEPFAITDESLFVNVGERTNITGSARFRRLIKDGDYGTALQVAAQQVEAGAQVIDLPAVEAVCGVHLGSMTTIGESWQAMHRWIVDNGLTFAGPCREVYLRAEGEDQSGGTDHHQRGKDQL